MIMAINGTMSLITVKVKVRTLFFCSDSVASDIPTSEI